MAASAARGKRGSPPQIGGDKRREAWEWAVAKRAPDGSLPSGRAIAVRYDRHERWGRLVKQAGMAGEFTGAIG